MQTAYWSGGCHSTAASTRAWLARSNGPRAWAGEPGLLRSSAPCKSGWGVGSGSGCTVPNSPTHCGSIGRFPTPCARPTRSSASPVAPRTRTILQCSTSRSPSTRAEHLYHEPALGWNEYTANVVACVEVTGDQPVPRRTMREPFVHQVSDDLRSLLGDLNGPCATVSDGTTRAGRSS